MEYLRALPGFDLDENMVLKFNKALYGLKQAARAQSQTLETFFRKIGFVPSHADHSLFISVDKNIEIFILVYVHDILLFGRHQNDIGKVIKDIENEYITRREETAEKVLGFIMEQHKTGICL